MMNFRSFFKKCFMFFERPIILGNETKGLIGNASKNKLQFGLSGSTGG